MAANTVLNYIPRKSVVHDLTGTTKLAFFLLFTFASMITYNTWVLLGLMAVSFAVFRLSHIKLREVRFMLVFMLVFLVLNDLFIFLFDRTRARRSTAPHGALPPVLAVRPDRRAAVLYVQHLAEIFCRAAGGHSVHLATNPVSSPPA